MALMMHTFRTRAGWDAAVLWCLSSAASAAIRTLDATSVLILLCLWLYGTTDALACTEPLRALVERVAPAIVSIEATRLTNDQTERLEVIAGSGFVIGSGQHVLTSAHVVAHAATVMVTLSTRQRIPARVLGLDLPLEVALLKIEPHHPHPLSFGDSSALRVGDDVIALGRSWDRGPTVTYGIVSDLNRRVPVSSAASRIVTDAPVPPDSVGGPLVDRCGRAVGVNAPGVSGGATTQRTGLAIPIDAAKATLRDLRQLGHVVRPWLGIRGQGLGEHLGRLLPALPASGYLVETIEAGSPADHAGIRGGTVSVIFREEEYLIGGDVVTAIQGVPVHTAHDYLARAAALHPGQRVHLTIYRAGRTLDLFLVAVEEPGPSVPGRR